jgi:hypothetical protein
MELAWFIALISAMCFEGLGRKYLPGIPDALFYFLKDVVLLFGYLRFRPSPTTWRAVKYLYRGFQFAFGAAFVWTLIEVFNPEQQSKLLALVGLRAYWLWWLAPPVIATALQKTRVKERAIYALLVASFAVAAMAAVQFASPADASINLYEGHDQYDMGPIAVESTGRARVSSTFTFVSGFVAFTLAVPTLLLSFGLEAKNPRLRTWALVGTMVTAAVVPMGGSRSSVVVGLAVLGLSVWSAGLFFTRVGRRVLIGAVAAAVISVVAFPDAMEGVRSRFGNREETSGRFGEAANVLPPVALATFNYPALGIGTGMQQNARFSFHVVTVEWEVESEIGRYLVELGPVGFLLFWITKLGLAVALFRAYRILKHAGRRGASAAALSYCAMTMTGNLTFDHNWQALYFLGCGFVLSDVLAVARQKALDAQRLAEDDQGVGPPPIRALALANPPSP